MGGRKKPKKRHPLLGPAQVVFQSVLGARRKNVSPSPPPKKEAHTLTPTREVIPCMMQGNLWAKHQNRRKHTTTGSKRTSKKRV